MCPMEPSPGSTKLWRKPSRLPPVLNIVVTQTSVITSSGIKPHHQPNRPHQKPSRLQALHQAQASGRRDPYGSNLLMPPLHKIKLPPPGDHPEGFWVVVVGQEVGIFFSLVKVHLLSSYILLTNWSRADVALCTNYVSGSVQKCYPSFAKAL